ncbi:hypothetical protein H2199_005487 [Coniosporium tulheliwenetii]|uniref:Uncharacterized protein n=1 Tax=Coniosporium tulheliwenetii TaxID=3383036 RepID=A0ACC2Z1U9_9PEZI|nr:hypothetical protein H2199_005487 [Cladosporium sp. JES 115]
MLFGYRPYRPFNCNISVGLSVFAVTPDCLFLFHDITKKTVFVFQCKGCFMDLLDEEEEVVLSESTSWEDLPRISYDVLARLRIPEPQKFTKDQIALQSRKVIDLNIYCDRLDEGTTSEIFDKDDDLKSILLTAQTRGRRDDVERWISKRRLQAEDPLRIQRQDVNDRASKLACEVFSALQSNSSDIEPARLALLQGQLRRAHEVNFEALTTQINSKRDSVAVRDVVVTDALARLELGKNSRRGSSCPSMLSPVSPSRSRQFSTGTAANVTVRPRAIQEGLLTSSPRPSKQAHRNVTHLRGHGSKEQQQHLDSHEPHQRHAERSQNEPERGHPSNGGFLFTPGFTASATKRADQCFHGTCSICRKEDTILALLFKPPPAEAHTDGFPEPGDQTELPYPLVAGRFPETDVIFPRLACEACSFFLARARLPSSDPSPIITGALPLVRLDTSTANKKTFLKTLEKIFEKRFDPGNLDLVFLAVLHNTTDYLTAGDADSNEVSPSPAELLRALKWASTTVSRVARISPALTPTPAPPPKNLRSAELLTVTPLIAHPLECFGFLLRAAADLTACGALSVPNDQPGDEDVFAGAVLARLLYHLAESHYAFQAERNQQEATRKLEAVVLRKQASAPVEDAPPAVSVTKRAVDAISFRQLEGSYLLSHNDGAIFRALGPWWGPVEQRCPSAIAVFLRILLEEGKKWRDAGEAYCVIRRALSKHE